MTFAMQESSRPKLVIALVAILAALLCGALAFGFLRANTEADTAPPRVAGQTGVIGCSGDLPEPGTVCSAVPAKSVVSTATAQRITYVSTDEFNKRMIVSATVFVPTKQISGARAIAVWGHASTGVAQGCSPYNFGWPLRKAWSPAYVRELTTEPAAIVVEPDLSGLGTPTPPSFLVGQLEGRGMIDAARAAMRLPGAGASTTSPVLYYGFSQGGHSVLFAGQLSQSYAPEVKAVGAIAFSPASLLGEQLEKIQGKVSGTVLGSLVLWSYKNLYSRPEYKQQVPVEPDYLTALTKPGATQTLPAIVKRCIVSGGFTVLLPPWKSKSKNFYKQGADPDTAPVWKDLIARNVPTGWSGGPPLVLISGAADNITPLTTQRTYFNGFCANGGKGRLYVVPNQGHKGTPGKTKDFAIDWMRARAAVKPVPVEGCEVQPG